MLKKRSSSNAIITLLLITILVMVVGYATLSVSLNVNGSSTIPNTVMFDVKFVDVVVSEINGATSSQTSFTNNQTSSIFSFIVNLKAPGDMVTYNITLKNMGTIDAEVGSFSDPIAWRNSHIITYNISGISIGDVINVGEEKTITLVIEWPRGTDIPEIKQQTLDFSINFVQKGTSSGSGEIVPIDYGYYHIDSNSNGIVDASDQIQMGTYPQTKVVDQNLITTLNTLAGILPVNGNNRAWTSYKYYLNASNNIDYMWYQDIVRDNNKYRGVYFTSYRSLYTTDYSQRTKQSTNGYYTDNVYWFKYEDIVWDVGSNDNGTLILTTHNIIDSHEFYIQDGSTRTINDATIYGNNYEHSTIRTWLNNDFYNTAFMLGREQALVMTTEVDNSAASTNSSNNIYYSNNTNDKVFLLSYQNIKNNTYYVVKTKAGTDYAKAQGLSVDTTNGNSSFRLRSPSNSASQTCSIDNTGAISLYNNVSGAMTGIAPTLKMILF